MQRRIIDFFESTESVFQVFAGLNHHHGLHFGYFDLVYDRLAVTISRREIWEAILKMNWVMSSIAGIRPGMHVLDAGCGVGGSAVWLARHVGARVTGVTLSERQCELARRHARRQGVENRVQFLVRDFHASGFPDASFDVVWSLEGMAYSPRKRDFLREVRRLLRPSGVMIVADGFRSRRRIGAQDERILRACLKGWAVPNIEHVDDLASSIAAVGFEELEQIDITANVAPFASWLHGWASLAAPGSRLLQRLGWVRKVQVDNIQAAIEQYRGLQRGLWKYMIIRAE